MNIVAAIRSEKRKIERQLRELEGRLNGLTAAAKALGDSAGSEVAKVKKRVLSAAARSKMSAAARKRWAKVKGGAKKALS